jgi:hypothetical protein
MDEFIKKSKAIELVMQYCPDDDGSCSKAGNDLRELLDEIEAINPENVKPLKNGEWIEGYNETTDKRVSRCSKCGYEKNRFRKPPYCENCGAEMK